VKKLMLITAQSLSGFLGHEDPRQHSVVQTDLLKETEMLSAESTMSVSCFVWSVPRAIQEGGPLQWSASPLGVTAGGKCGRTQSGRAPVLPIKGQGEKQRLVRTVRDVVDVLEQRGGQQVEQRDAKRRGIYHHPGGEVEEVGSRLGVQGAHKEEHQQQATQHRRDAHHRDSKRRQTKEVCLAQKL
jgi:hypothetical protein